MTLRRMPDPDPPWLLRAGCAAGDDVAARIDGEVLRALGGQQRGGAIDRPTLDERGRVEMA